MKKNQELYFLERENKLKLLDEKYKNAETIIDKINFNTKNNIDEIRTLLYHKNSSNLYKINNLYIKSLKEIEIMNNKLLFMENELDIIIPEAIKNNSPKYVPHLRNIMTLIKYNLEKSFYEMITIKYISNLDEKHKCEEKSIKTNATSDDPDEMCSKKNQWLRHTLESPKNFKIFNPTYIDYSESLRKSSKRIIHENEVMMKRKNIVKAIEEIKLSIKLYKKDKTINSSDKEKYIESLEKNFFKIQRNILNQQLTPSASWQSWSLNNRLFKRKLQARIYNIKKYFNSFNNISKIKFNFDTKILLLIEAKKNMLNLTKSHNNKIKIIDLRVGDLVYAAKKSTCNKNKNEFLLEKCLLMPGRVTYRKKSNNRITIKIKFINLNAKDNNNNKLFKLKQDDEIQISFLQKKGISGKTGYEYKKKMAVNKVRPRILFSKKMTKDIVIDTNILPRRDLETLKSDKLYNKYIYLDSIKTYYLQERHNNDREIYIETDREDYNLSELIEEQISLFLEEYQKKVIFYYIAAGESLFAVDAYEYIEFYDHAIELLKYIRKKYRDKKIIKTDKKYYNPIFLNKIKELEKYKNIKNKKYKNQIKTYDNYLDSYIHSLYDFYYEKHEFKLDYIDFLYKINHLIVTIQYFLIDNGATNYSPTQVDINTHAYRGSKNTNLDNLFGNNGEIRYSIVYFFLNLLEKKTFSINKIKDIFINILIRGSYNDSISRRFNRLLGAYKDMGSERGFKILDTFQLNDEEEFMYNYNTKNNDKLFESDSENGNSSKSESESESESDIEVYYSYIDSDSDSESESNKITFSEDERNEFEDLPNIFDRLDKVFNNLTLKAIRI